MYDKFDLQTGTQKFLGETHELFINGKFVQPVSGKTFETVDPATGSPLATVGEAGSQDIDLAVAAARAALTGPWARIPVTEREQLIRRLGDLIIEHADELAELESLDNGKPLAASRGVDVPLTAAHFHHFAGWPSKISGQTLPTAFGSTMHAYTQAKPVGVVGAIIPWNFPLLMAAWKLAPALAAGCTVVLKPAEQTPLTALFLARLVAEAGFPNGVVNVCPGFGSDAGAALAAHPDVDLVAFTGSTPVGRSIATAAAQTLTHVSLELGGKSPNIIFADADLDVAGAAAANAIFFLSGQVCSAGSRLFVQRPVLDRILGSILDFTQNQTLGHGLAPTTTLGPLVSQEQLDRVSHYVDLSRQERADIITGGSRPQAELSDGYFFEPTVVLDDSNRLTISREEVFGPVLVVQPFDDLTDLISRANGTDFGLGAGVWTTNLATAHTTAAALQAGCVWINCYNYFDAAVPFGGVKQSGYGRDGGEAALNKFIEYQTVWTNLG